MQISCVWWNVDNLFPFVAGATDNYRPATYQDYQTKLQALAGVLSSLKPPIDLLLLGEIAIASAVQGQDAVADLLKQLNWPYDHHLPRHGDARGITCAAAWRPSLLRNTAVRQINVCNAHNQQLGRPILELEMRTAHNRDFVVYLNHWTSRRGGYASSKPKRNAAGRELAALVQQRICTRVDPNADPNAPILAVGDFNDDPFNPSLTDFADNEHQQYQVGSLAITRDRTDILNRQPAAEFPVLYNPTWRLMAEPLCRAEELASGDDLPPGSLRFGEWWNAFDQVLVSAGALQRPPVFDEREMSYVVIPPLLHFDGTLSGTPSDHLPLRFNLNM